MKVIAGMLVMIALFGLFAGVQAEGADERLVAVHLRRARA
jgi:hypothetical protein